MPNEAEDEKIARGQAAEIARPFLEPILHTRVEELLTQIDHLVTNGHFDKIPFWATALVENRRILRELGWEIRKGQEAQTKKIQRLTGQQG